MAVTEFHAYPSFKILTVGIMLINITYLFFVASFLGIARLKRNALWFYTILNLFFVLLAFYSRLYTGLESRFGLGYWPVPTAWFHIYLFFWFLQCIHGFVWLLRGLVHTSGLKQLQVKYFTTAALIGFAGGATNWPMWYGIPLPPYPNILISLYIGIVAYAMLKYRMMDIKLVITRTGIFIAVYTIVLGIPFALAVWAKGWLIEILAARWWTAPLGLMAFLATLGPFIYIYLEHRAEAQIMKTQRRYQSTLKHASVGMTRIRDLRKLLMLITHIVTKTVRISFASIYLFDPDNNRYILHAHRDRGRSFVEGVDAFSDLIMWLHGKHEPLICEEIKRISSESSDGSYRKILQEMERLGAAVVVPSFLEQRLIGFIVLGEKLSGQIYTSEDLDVFQVLATQSALAIENAQFYEEAKRMQEQIAQAEKMATVGTMADGLSHQINNRFYALSLIASDSIDTIKMTDTSHCSPEVRQMIETVNRALERIQVNVMQGGEVVKGILKYTRKGEEGFEPLTLNEILDATLDMVRYKIKITEVDVIRQIPEDAPKIRGNRVQLQEAFFNLIDNAYEAIMERRSLVQEKDFRGRITIALYPPNDHTVTVTIEDNGMGVKEQNSKKLFTPFFTTKTSSRKGTGLGLYVIKRIISEMHGGNIQVESEHGKGTRFTLTLPHA